LTLHIHAVPRSRVSGAIPYCWTGKSLPFLHKYISTLSIQSQFSETLQYARKPMMWDCVYHNFTGL